MSLRTFADLLLAAREQPEPQRLLLVFASVELPSDASAAQREAFERGEGGVLTPVLCVDKAPDEIADFAALCDESKNAGINWQLVFVGSLPGKAGHPPSADEAARPLKLMVESIRGGRIASFLTVDRQGELIQLRAA